MKKMLFTLLLFASFHIQAQKIDSIYINLYTDSLKKGTYNYINIDGLYSNGKYLPLDSTDIIFASTHGKFYGNSLWVDKEFKEEKIKIKVMMRTNHVLCKEFVMYIKKKDDNDHLMTNEELIEKMKSDHKKKKDKKS